MAQGQILDSKEYFAPIITPYEAQLAFTPGKEWGEEYRLDFGSLLLSDERQQGRREDAGDEEEEPRFSLVDGLYHGALGSSSAATSESRTLSERKTQELLNVDPSKRHLVEAGIASFFTPHQITCNFSSGRSLELR